MRVMVWVLTDIKLHVIAAFEFKHKDRAERAAKRRKLTLQKQICDVVDGEVLINDMALPLPKWEEVKPKTGKEKKIKQTVRYNAWQACKNKKQMKSDDQPTGDIVSTVEFVPVMKYTSPIGEAYDYRHMESFGSMLPSIPLEDKKLAKAPDATRGPIKPVTALEAAWATLADANVPTVHPSSIGLGGYPE